MKTRATGKANPSIIRRKREQARHETLPTRDSKMAILAAIALNTKCPGRERISAIKLHNEMTSDNAPQSHTKNDHEEWLRGIRERARNIVSPLARMPDATPARLLNQETAH